MDEWLEWHGWAWALQRMQDNKCSEHIALKHLMCNNYVIQFTWCKKYKKSFQWWGLFEFVLVRFCSLGFIMHHEDLYCLISTSTSDWVITFYFANGRWWYEPISRYEFNNQRSLLKSMSAVICPCLERNLNDERHYLEMFGYADIHLWQINLRLSQPTPTVISFHPLDLPLSCDSLIKFAYVEVMYCVICGAKFHTAGYWNNEYDLEYRRAPFSSESFSFASNTVNT